MKNKKLVKPSSESFVYKTIKFSDENIIEKIHNFEDVSKRKKGQRFFRYPFFVFNMI